MFQAIKRNWVRVIHLEINDNFNNIAKITKGVAPSNIINLNDVEKFSVKEAQCTRIEPDNIGNFWCRIRWDPITSICSVQGYLYIYDTWTAMVL